MLEKEVFDLVKSFGDVSIAKSFLENIERNSGQKMITKSVLGNNVAVVKNFVNKLENENKEIVEKTFVKLGLSMEVTHEREVRDVKKEDNEKDLGYKIFYADTLPDRKLEVKDFVGNFRARYQELQRILMNRQELQNNLVSINKISGNRQSLSIIGIVKEKRVTKNKNLIITFEDLTGEISALVKFDNQEIFEKASELQLDDVVGVKASGNNDLLFVHDIFFPDSFIDQKVSFDEDYNIVFLSDLHTGSEMHLRENFERFLDWLNSDEEEAKKIKYIFFTGDNVDGVGIFPGQEDVLDLKSMEEQYELVSYYMKRIPKDKTIFMCPGQHDATRVAEPQPVINKKYAPGLYEIENLVLVTNPTMVKLLEGEKELKILMYHGASLHSIINEVKELRLMKAHHCPAKAVKHLLKRRHLAPSHSAVVYIPHPEKDPLVISEVPDIICTGEIHRPDIENYNGVLIMTGSCWQSQTPFEEKVGNLPDPAKVTLFNVNSRQIKILDFSDENSVKGDDEE